MKFIYQEQSNDSHVTQSTSHEETPTKNRVDDAAHAPSTSAVAKERKRVQSFRFGVARDAGQIRTPDKIIKAAELATAKKQMIDDTPIIDLGVYNLIEGDFPFDESQFEAIDGVLKYPYACIMGAAGTGKTTCLKAIIERLHTQITSVNISRYWHKNSDEKPKPDSFIPSIAMCAFTGRATQMIKKNFSRAWHRNIMTVHRMLGFYPEFYTVRDDKTGELVNKMRFIPYYTAQNKMPWDVIAIDEGGMLAIDLWEKLWAACKKSTRIIMIGDINQLPPVHGTSVFGFAMTQWPTFELRHIHRQKGKLNPIVENAWRILEGKMPKSLPGFQMMEVSDDSQIASKQLRKGMLVLNHKGIYQPMRDTVITATNGEPGQRGMALGQKPLNEYMAIQLNPDAQRYLIDAGRERRGFAIGDKVMVTYNDVESGLTNGMTGKIVSVSRNPEYLGTWDFVGKIEDVKAHSETHDVGEEITVAQFMADQVLADTIEEKEKEERARGMASHIVTVRFGDDANLEEDTKIKGFAISNSEESFEVPFSTFTEVMGLQLAYVITCHKSQGGEYPFVMIMAHQTHGAMLYREWLYTAVTRSSETVLLMYNASALRGALRKQKIKGDSLEAKIESFVQLSQNKLRKQPTLPVYHWRTYGGYPAMEEDYND